MWGGGSTEGGGSEVLLRARVLCCAGVRPGMRSWRSMLHVVASTKTTEWSVCVALFSLNRYWGIVTVPGSFLKAGDLG